VNVANNHLPGVRAHSPILWLTIAAMAMLVTACSGGSTTSPIQPQAAVACDPNDPSTAAECGTIYVGLTDADGDFLSYSVNVVSLQLQKADGTLVETLPNNTRIDFAQYVELTEFVSAATVPPGTYVAGNITLDYSDAEIMVEENGIAKLATVVDEQGTPLTQTTLKIMLADRDKLIITRGRPSLLVVDFDLGASHSVDIVPTPAIATAEPFIVAEIDPVDQKEIRVRGPLVNVSEDAMTYTVALRPFHDRNSDFGRLKVHVTDSTEFEVDEIEYTGVEGLRALNAAGQGTPTVAHGTLNVAEREFTAEVVLAGSSVPGSDRDAIKGNVIARSGNELVVRGGTVILSDATRSFFRDDVTVTIGPDTKVFKRSRDGALDISAISIGQRVTIRGEVTANDELGVHMDATQGAVRMHITHLSGVVNSVLPGQTDITLHAIDRRRVSVFDFTGTGATPEWDADPDNYEVATGILPMSILAEGRPVVAYGFPNEFGAAPPDFEGRTLIDFSEVRSALGVGWGATGTIAPFLSMGSDGLVLNNRNPDIDQRHFIKQGPVLIDLTTLDSGTSIVARETGRKLFAIKTTDSLQLYADFGDFVNALTLELNGSTVARSMFARGLYDADTNVFTAYKIGIHLIEP
jgi:hypothetical protein